MFYSLASFKKNFGFSSLLILASLACSHTVLAMEDDEKGLKQHKHSAKREYLQSEFDLAVSYAKSEDKQKNQKAIKKFKLLSEKGRGEATYHLAKMYCEGRGVDEDEKEAHKFLEKAADQGHIMAQLAMVHAFWGLEWESTNNGHYYEAIEFNEEKIATFLKLGVAQENADAQFFAYYSVVKRYGDSNLGELLEFSAPKLYDLLQRSANQGHLFAQYNLGLEYETGVFCWGEKTEPKTILLPQDKQKALELYIHAADQGQRSSLFRMIDLAKEITIGAKETREMFSLCRRETDQGSHLSAWSILKLKKEDSTYKEEAFKLQKVLTEELSAPNHSYSRIVYLEDLSKLAEMYEQGYGTPINNLEAAKCYYNVINADKLQDPSKEEKASFKTLRTSAKKRLNEIFPDDFTLEEQFRFFKFLADQQDNVGADNLGELLKVNFDEEYGLT